MWKSRLPAPRHKEGAMKCGEEPGFDLPAIAELMALGGPDVERLLSQILGIGFRSGQAHCEPEQGFVMVVNDCLKSVGRLHFPFAFRVFLRLGAAAAQWDYGAGDRPSGRSRRITRNAKGKCNLPTDLRQSLTT